MRISIISLKAKWSCGPHANHLQFNFHIREWGGQHPPKEYWIIYRGPVFIAVVWFGSSSTSYLLYLSRQQVVSLSQSSCVSLVQLGDGRGEEKPNHTMRKLVLYKSFITPLHPQSFRPLVPPTSSLPPPPKKTDSKFQKRIKIGWIRLDDLNGISQNENQDL